MFKVYELPRGVTETDFYPRWVIDCGKDVCNTDYRAYLFAFQDEPMVTSLWKSHRVDWFSERRYATVGWAISELEAKKILKNRSEEFDQERLTYKNSPFHIHREDDNLEWFKEAMCQENQGIFQDQNQGIDDQLG